MARYRIGNDMTIIWSVTNKDGSSFPLAGKEVHLYYTCERGRFEADIEIQNSNVIVWNFLGSSQRALGDYTLILEILQSNGKRVIRRDICNAFTFVGKSCEGRHGNEDGEINNDGVINLVSELEIYRISPIIPYVVKDENGIGYWYVDGVNTGDRSTGESAYEYAKKKGYEGTEEEYAECLAYVASAKNDIETLKDEKVFLTEAEYDSLEEKDESKLYFVFEK